MTQPLYRESNAPFYQAELTDNDRLIFQWRAGILRQNLPRLVASRRKWPGLIIYTDAATETTITASLVFDRAGFCQTGEILAVRTEVVSAERIELFLDANLIYGLELLGIVLTTAGSSLDLGNKSITYYIDNNTAISALVQAGSKRIVIAILARLFRALIARRGITPWFERVDSTKNIADLPTRHVDLPYSITGRQVLPFATPLLKMVQEANRMRIINGFFDPDELVGRFYNS